jgi:hypothetical protein
MPKKVEEVEKAILFVFYNINPNSPNKSWNYGKFPKDWYWVGGGSVKPLMGKKIKSAYIQEEQFNGPIKTKEKMKDYLENFFTNLKKKKIITQFKIRNSYLP